MTKQGYTWYLKDWQTSEAVFQLNLQERGLYRELIDLAMINDNKTKVNTKLWGRKFNDDVKQIEESLQRLVELDLVKLKNNAIFIPSCETRLNIIRGASRGGKKSRKPKGTKTHGLDGIKLRSE